MYIVQTGYYLDGERHYDNPLREPSKEEAMFAAFALVDSWIHPEGESIDIEAPMDEERKTKVNNHLTKLTLDNEILIPSGHEIEGIGDMFITIREIEEQLEVRPNNQAPEPNLWGKVRNWIGLPKPTEKLPMKNLTQL